jgi:hypothetical protein
VAACIAASDKGLDLKKQGKLLEARRILASCAATACGADIAGVCQKRITDINAVLPSIVFLPKDASGHDLVDVKMTVDGVRTETLDGRPVTLDPGAHAFRFEAAGLPPVDRSFVLAEGVKERQERIDMGPTPTTEIGSTAETAGSAGAQPSGGGGSKTLGIVLTGAGILGVTAGSVFGLMAILEWSQSRSDCGSPSNCNRRSAAVSEHDTASTEGTASTVAFAVGGAALAVGAYLWITAPHRAATTGRSREPIRIEPIVTPNYAGLAVRGGLQ